jgi:hypothetical protein
MSSRGGGRARSPDLTGHALAPPACMHVQHRPCPCADDTPSSAEHHGVSVGLSLSDAVQQRHSQQHRQHHQLRHGGPLTPRLATRAEAGSAHTRLERADCTFSVSQLPLRCASGAAFAGHSAWLRIQPCDSEQSAASHLLAGGCCWRHFGPCVDRNPPMRSALPPLTLPRSAVTHGKLLADSSEWHTACLQRPMGLRSARCPRTRLRSRVIPAWASPPSTPCRATRPRLRGRFHPLQ